MQITNACIIWSDIYSTVSVHWENVREPSDWGGMQVHTYVPVRDEPPPPPQSPPPSTRPPSNPANGWLQYFFKKSRFIPHTFLAIPTRAVRSAGKRKKWYVTVKCMIRKISTWSRNKLRLLTILCGASSQFRERIAHYLVRLWSVGFHQSLVTRQLSGSH